MARHSWMCYINTACRYTLIIVTVIIIIPFIVIVQIFSIPIIGLTIKRIIVVSTTFIYFWVHFIICQNKLLRWNEPKRKMLSILISLRFLIQLLIWLLLECRFDSFSVKSSWYFILLLAFVMISRLSSMCECYFLGFDWMLFYRIWITAILWDTVEYALSCHLAGCYFLNLA